MERRQLVETALFALSLIGCGGDDVCVAVQNGICNISAPAEVASGAPFVVEVRFEYTSPQGYTFTHRLDGSQITIEEWQCPCCASCSCEWRVLSGRYEIPPLLPGQYHLEAGRTSDACTGNTSVDIVVKP